MMVSPPGYSFMPLELATMQKAQLAALRFVRGPPGFSPVLPPVTPMIPMPCNSAGAPISAPVAACQQVEAQMAPSPAAQPAAAVASAAVAPPATSAGAATVQQPPASTAGASGPSRRVRRQAGQPEEKPAAQVAPAPAPAPASSSVALPKRGPTPTVREPMRQRTWAEMVGKAPTQEEPEHLILDTNSSGSTSPSSYREDGAWPEFDGRLHTDTIIDCLLYLAENRRVKGIMSTEAELPQDFQRFKTVIEEGLSNSSPARYYRRGMKNDANNCYVNVVIQSLLPCGALMQFLSHCPPSDPARPFHSCLVRVCKEFHCKDNAVEAFNILSLPQVKEIISAWHAIGSQQDAGEFLFYTLNGMHEECKWKSMSSQKAFGNSSGEAKHADDWAEDSPIVRIFGGVIRSVVRSKLSKADSISTEPFNHLILDISQPSVDSVWAALEAYCNAETVDEGRATKRLQFKVMPKVLILNLKRFSYNKDTGSPQKIKKSVKYEDRLVFDRSWLVDDLEPQEYHLTAVICHHGDTVHGGHYNAVTKYTATSWYLYDDGLVRQSSVEEATSQENSYLLVYMSSGNVPVAP